MATERRLRVAIIGAGLMGRWHAAAAQRAGGEVVTIIDPDQRRAVALAARCPRAEPADDPSAALARYGVDVVHVCAPTPRHVDLTRLALESGAHAIVEKPLAPTRGVTAELLNLARSRQRLLCPAHQFLFQRGVVRLLDTRAALGPIVHVEALVCSAGADGRSDDATDRIAAEILPHPLSLLARIFPQELPDARWQAQRPRAGELRIGGVLGEVTLSVVISMAGRPTLNRLHLIGERASARVDLYHGFQVTEAGTVSRLRKATRPLTLSGQTFSAALANLVGRAARREWAYPGLSELVGRFYVAVRTGAQAPIAHEEILAVAEARDVLLGILERARADGSQPMAAGIDRV